MDAGFINLTPENLDGEHLCCIIRSKKAHPGVEAKRQWLADRLKEGHIFRKLNAKATVFIEYAPLETAWTPVLGDSYYYIYCLWVCGESKGKGYGRALMEYCLADARAKGKSGVCMLGALRPVLESPVLAPAFANILPALFGGLAVVYVSKDWKIALAPLIFMVVLFLCVPSLSSSVGVLVPVGALLAIGVARILYKKGKL